MFGNVKPGDSGVYACRGRARSSGPSKRHNAGVEERIVERQMELTVRRLAVPEFVDTFNMNNGVMYVKEDGETVEMKCLVAGVPRPTVAWFLNDTAIDFAADLNYQLFEAGQALRVAAVLAHRNEGTYTCRASSRAGVAHLQQTIVKVDRPYILYSDMKYIFDYVKVESPSIYETNLAGSQQIIDTQHLAQLRLQPGTSLNLTCKQHFLQIFST